MSSLSISAKATVSGPELTAPVTDTLFSDTLPLPPEVSIPVEIYEKFFGKPTFSVDASDTEASHELKLSFKVLSFSKSYTIPYTIPSLIQGWIDDVKGQGYTVDIEFSAVVS